LNKLAGEEPFIIDKAIHPDQFQRELRHMRDLRLIETLPDKGIRIMYQEPGQHANVRDYFRITDNGRRYLEMRRTADRDGAEIP
jgi:DNA-binding PadR family transcriptional regulator